jgi:LacI family transcriptional regulator
VRARPTIKDIAAEVGVSHTTVSYILSGNTTQKISPATRKAVLDAAKRLQYVPNSAARSLRNNSTHCVSVAMEKALTNTRFSGLLQGIRESLQAEGYWIMLFDFSTSSPPYPDFLESVLQRRTDGIIYISSDGYPPEEHCRQMIIDNTLPFVACDCCPEEPELVSVSFDYERGAFEVACRLFGEGARRILYWRPDVQSLQEGYRSRVCAVRRSSTQEWIFRISPAFQHLRVHERPPLRPEPDMQPAPGPGDPAAHCRLSAWGCRSLLLERHGKPPKRRLERKGQGAENRHPVRRGASVVTDTQILTSRSNFVRGGKECTALLLRQLRGESCSSVVLPPDIPSYINS